MQRRFSRQGETDLAATGGGVPPVLSPGMDARDLPQKPAIRRFKALLDSLDQPHDPEYHWLRNERRSPDQPPLHAAPGPGVWELPYDVAEAPSHELRRRITDTW